MSGRVERVCVVGRDAAAWLAAAALNRALGRSGLLVRLVELPSLAQPVDAFASVPSLRGLHRMLGIAEGLVLGLAKAVPMVAQRYSNWAGAAPPFLLGFDDPAAPGGDLDFTHYWLKGRLEGLKVGFEDFLLGPSAARQGRVPVTREGQDAPATAAFGYHLDARGYADLLRRYALANGVESRSARSAAPQLDGDRIAALLLDDGERIEADLFVDATGSEGTLIGAMPGGEFESWSDLFPANRLLAASAPRLADLPGFSEVSAFRAGWVGLYPLQDRTAVVAAYDNQAMPDEEVVRSLAILARMPISGDAVVAPFEAGMRRSAWIGNCVAIGEAAAVLEPLDSVQLHLAHSGVSHLITLFPTASERMPEANSYNRIVAGAARNVRDFQLAHYRLNRRFDEPMWDRAREAAVPDSLERKMRLFEARGLVPLNDEESFQEMNWTALFLGHGLEPRGYDPRVDWLPDEQHIARVQQRLRDVAQLVRAMPSIGDYVAAAQQARSAEMA